jgi:YgiT-type zinc finger domain-containing protein
MGDNDANQNGWAELDPCELCGGECEATEITLPIFDRDDHIVLVEHVPAIVCLECGEMFVDDEVDERLETVDWVAGEPTSIAHVPVYDYAGS